MKTSRGSQKASGCLPCPAPFDANLGDDLAVFKGNQQKIRSPDDLWDCYDARSTISASSPSHVHVAKCMRAHIVQAFRVGPTFGLFRASANAERSVLRSRFSVLRLKREQSSRGTLSDGDSKQSKCATCARNSRSRILATIRSHFPPQNMRTLCGAGTVISEEPIPDRSLLKL